MTTAPSQDVQPGQGATGALDEEGAIAAFMADWQDDADDQPSDADAAVEAGAEEDNATDASEADNEPSEDEAEDDNGDETDPEEDSEDTDEDGEDDQAEDEADPKEAASDDMEVTVKVGDEEKKVSVKDLKRLYGQEASLTRKSQEVADEKAKVTEEREKHSNALKTMTEKAQERWKPYSEIDFFVASKNMSTEDFQALRKEAEEAYNDYKYLTEELDGQMTKAQEQSQAQFQERAQEAIKVLSDPEQGIPGWGPQLYNDIRSFAVSKGMAAEAVNGIVDPAAIKIINLAMQAEKAKQTASAKKTKPKASTSGKKTVKTTQANSGSRDKGKKALDKVRQSGGSVESVADAFMADWE